LALQKAGQFDQAETIYKNILETQPGQPDALNLLGVIELKRGNHERAVDLLSASIEINPHNAAALSNLGSALVASGDLPEAIATLRAAIALNPESAGNHHNLGFALQKSGDFEAAAESSRRALEISPDYAEAHHCLATTLAKSESDLANADQAYRAAIGLRPSAVDWIRDYAAFLLEINRIDECVVQIDRALALAPDSAELLLRHAEAIFRSGDVAAGEAEYRRITERIPKHAGAWSGLGWVELTLGRFEAAGASLRQAIKLNPNQGDAHRLLGVINRGATGAGEIDELTAVVDEEKNRDMSRITAGFALGKKLDDAGQYDEAFARFQEANLNFRILRGAGGRRYSPNHFREFVDSLIAKAPPTRAVIRSEIPVFIVGMPRSGTTLVEQIAASHPSVFGAGELVDIQLIASGRNPLHPSVARGHLEKLRRLAPNAARVINKTPDNIVFLDLISRLFEQPRVIICERDPRDNCLSNYFTCFTKGNYWSNDLTDCGLRNFEIHRLAAHWRTLPSMRIHTIQYETLVADLEGESRRMIEFLGLPWDEACLSFHETERAVTTPSLWQVRQPIYTQSVGRWRHYEKHLAPLMAGLAGPT
jgi:tetratricopeptide (TPR) repeat protein